MAEETKAAGAAGAEGAKDDVDVVKVAVWFLLVLLVGLTAVLFVLQKYRDDFRGAVEFGEKNLRATAIQYDAVKGLLKTFRDSGADEARRETRSWLKIRHTAAGITDAQLTTQKWEDKPAKDYVEHVVNVVVKDASREKLIHFLWNVENMSTKMRTVEMTIKRTPPNNAPEADVWELRATFGYRVPRGFKEGG